ncbi:MAG: 50S ribosomal protein L19 [Candidatus Gracilibacteria bacterium]|nr:50S ribosomal protein L19 [Candidatus Gracilibacteria bacterium]
MDAALIKVIQQGSVTDERAEIVTGMEVEVHQIIKEGNKERIQKFKGLVIKTHGKTTLDKTITVRKDVDGVGIEKIFPVYSPGVAKIEILRSFKVRRSNITFIRDLKGKAARLKEVK